MRVLLWLRFRLLLGTLRGWRSRNSLERVSRASEFVMPLVSVAIAVPIAVLGGVLGWLLGRALASDPHATMFLGLRYALAAITIVMLLALLFRAAEKGPASWTQMLVLPIPLTTLHRTEVASRLFDPWLFPALPGLLLLSAGLAWSGRWQGATLALASSVVLLWLLASLLSLASFMMALLLRRSSWRETFLLWFIAVICLAPLLGIASDPGEAAGPRLLRSIWEEETVPSWLGIFPSELHVRALETGSVGCMLLLLGLACVTHAASAAAYRRVIEEPAEGGRRTARGARSSALLRIPLLSPGAAAVAETEIRDVVRSLQGKTILYLGPVYTLAMGFALRARPDIEKGGLPAFHHGAPWAAVLLMLCLMSLSGPMVNQHARSGGGLTLVLLSPIVERDVILGKATGFAVLFLMSAVLTLAPLPLVAPGDHPGLWASVPLGILAVFVVLAPVTATIAALFPGRRDSRTGTMRDRPHELAALLGVLLPSLLTMPPIGLVLYAVRVLGSAWLAPILLAGWLALSVAVAIPLFMMAITMLHERRESVIQAARGV